MVLKTKVSDSAIVKRLNQILKEADLHRVTTEDVIRQLDLKLGCDMSEKRQFIREQIEIFLENSLDDEVGENVVLEDDSDDDSDYGKKRLQQRINRAISESLPMETKKPIAKKRKRVQVAENVTKDVDAPVRLSHELREFLGTRRIRMTRLAVIKLIWKYIQSMNLQDSSDNRMIVCDEKLGKLLDCEEFSGFGDLPQLLKGHFINKTSRH